MNETFPPFIEQLISRWVAFVERNNIALIIGIILLTLSSLFYIKNNLGMSTSTTDMLSEELPWRKLDIEYEKLFPQFLDNILIVIESETPDQASDSAKKLYDALNADPKLINDIYYPSLLPYFRQSAFLFLDQDELHDLADQLAQIQPFLGTLLQDKNLRGLFNMLADALQAKEDGEDIDLKPLLIEINRTLEDRNYQVSWQHLMDTNKETKSIYREFIMLQVEESDTEFLPGDDVIKYIRSTINANNLNNDSVNIRLTGGTVLSNEELQSVSEANIQAIAISVLLVATILTLGLGSIWLVFACLLTLLMGLITTTAFATLTVGELNLISVAFAVLYIGLGIDFAIHLTLRYRERILLTSKIDGALKIALSKIFRSIVLCAITTAIGFYSFIPTDYQGVAELGWIAGSGMFISLLYTFTLLPALLSLRSYKPSQKSINNNSYVVFNLLSKLPYQYPQHILIITALISIGILLQIDKLSFDFNTLNLQNPENESVQTYRDLLNDSDTSPWNSILLKQSRYEALKSKQQFEQLKLVEDVVWLEDLVPKEQEDKLFVIDEMNLFMGPLEINSTTELEHGQRINAINTLLEKLGGNTDDALSQQVGKLEQHLNKLLDNASNTSSLKDIERRMLNSLDGRIQSLNDALAAEEVSLDDMPAMIKERWLSDDTYKLTINPVENLNENAAMKRFVKQVQAEDTEVIGSPIIRVEAGDAVISAFKSALSYALLAITLLLLILIKVKLDAAIILVSVLIGAVFTFGFMLLFNIPLNFANIIGLPLLLGIGVDSGIHISDRFRQEQTSNRNIFTTSASRGVIVSSLTTIFSIGNLAFSSHLGTASMGLLLATGLISMMISTMLILPSFLIWQKSLGEKSHAR